MKRIGWEVGIRTPIDRSRVLQRPKQTKKFNNLARQIKKKSGRIRNTPAMKSVKASSLEQGSNPRIEQSPSDNFPTTPVA